MAKNLVQEAKDKLQPILAAIEALDAHYKKHGENAEAAFNPNDKETSQLFQNLWKVSFDKHFSGELQQEIVNQMERSHLPALRRMRHISVISEIEMEKGHAKNAIAAADGISGEWSHSKEIRELREKIKHAQASNDGEKEKELQRWLVLAKTLAFYDLCKGYPYHTYHTLVSSENPLVASVEGRSVDVQEKGTHLVVEAGAIPFTAIFSSILRNDGNVIGTIGDPECYKIALDFLNRMERFGIVEPEKIKLVHATPEQLKDRSLVAKHTHGVVPYAATVTQVLEGKSNTEKAARVLQAHGIDTVVVRGAHGLVRMLYEPLDNMISPPGFGTHCLAAPKSKSDTTLCYNSSHLFSSRRLLAIPNETPTHTFHDVAQARAKSA